MSVPAGHIPSGHLPTGHIPEISDGGPTPAGVDVRQRFAVTFPFYSPDETDFYTFRPAVKDPGEQLKVELDFFLWCAHFVRPNDMTVEDEHFYPTRATGLIYKSGGGRTGFREPQFWPRTEDEEIKWGAATFTAVADGGEALTPISDPTASSDPSGLSTIDVSASENTLILATYDVGGSDGEDFDAVYTFTLNGATRKARQKVMVRKR